MDELIIEDKKYVSSKQAAKITGYAKDYIGQLCREGRVTARLVGRSWYVLESAIHDHRFNEKREDAPASPSAAVFSSTWGAPRYEAAPAEELPLMDAPAEDAGVAQQLQDSWKAWFDRVDTRPPEEVSMIALKESAQEEPKDEPTEEMRDTDTVAVPIRAIHHPGYKPLPHELKPQHIEIPQEEVRQIENEVYEPRNGAVVMRSMQIAGVLMALLMVGLAVAGSGYFDSYILNTQHFGSFAGVGFYNR